MWKLEKSVKRNIKSILIDHFKKTSKLQMILSKQSLREMQFKLQNHIKLIENN